MSSQILSNLTASAVFLVWILVLWLVKRIVFRRLRSWASRFHLTWGSVLVTALDSPTNWIIFAFSAVLLIDLLPIPESVHRLSVIGLKGGAIFSLVFFADNLIRLSGRTAGMISSGVIQGLLRGFTIGLGALIFLQLIGISITPILASLGIGSLAVALALQDTLSNFFAGIYVSVDKPVQKGDFIRLETGDEGCVSDVGWRSTRIRTGNNNVVIIPNAKLMGSVLTNYNLPTREVAIAVEFTVAHDSDLGKVEKVACEAAASLQGRVPGLVKGTEPVLHFQSFMESGIRGVAVLRAREFSEIGPVKHELIKAIHERFKKEGIVLGKNVLFSGSVDQVLKR